MTDKIKNIILTSLFLIVVFLFCGKLLFSQPDNYSYTERRELAKKPEIKTESGEFNEKFMSEYENYTLDAFPYRDSFRAIKMYTSLKIFNHLTANGLYDYKGYIAEQTEGLKAPAEKNLEYINAVIEKYISGKTDSVYVSLIPDKNYYLANESGRKTFDYSDTAEYIKSKVPLAGFIDVSKHLNFESYYKTDTHWTQDKITGCAEYVASVLNTKIPTDYTKHTLDKEFSGVYVGQIAYPVKNDKIIYLTNDIIDSLKVTNITEKGAFEEGAVYDFDKTDSRDLYDFFMSGAVPLSIITNPKADSTKELIIFRDSFGSAISPLLAQGYSKTTVVDLRYILPMFLQTVNFTNADVLFMYSPLVLNSPSVFKPLV